MKIAVLIDTWFPFVGGGQINALEISRRIAATGAQIDILTRNNGNYQLRLPKNIRVIKVPPSRKVPPYERLSKISFLIWSFFYIYKRDYDLVHAHAFLPGIVARLLMVTKGKPGVFTVHGSSLGTSLLNPISKRLEKFILTEIFYSSQITVSQDFLKFKNINKKVVYIPNGVDIKKFDKVKNKKNKKFTILFVGRLHPQKNLAILISAINTLKNFTQLELLIIGDGPQKILLKRIIKRLKLQTMVKMLGVVKGINLIKLYKSSDILILPSIYEGQPLALLEAWAARIPVISSKTGDCQYLIKDGKNGYLIDNPENIVEIASVIKKALKNKKNLDSMGKNGYNFVKKNNSWQKSARRTLNIYESLTNSKN